MQKLAWQRCELLGQFLMRQAGGAQLYKARAGNLRRQELSIDFAPQWVLDAQVAT
jgi:hypothetical protein